MMMHFRQYVLNSLLIGTALFVPTVALADKADHVEKPLVQNEKTAESVAKAVQKNEKPAREKVTKPITEIKKAKPIMKVSVPVAHSNQVGKDKNAQIKKPLPEQASNIAKKARHDAHQKNKQASKVTAPVKAASKTGKKTGQAMRQKVPPVMKESQPRQNHPVKQVEAVKRPETLHIVKPEEMNEVSSIKTVGKLTKQKPPDINKKNIMKNASISARSVPIEKKKTPISGKGTPIDLHVIITAPANDHSAGSSNDRTNLGHSTISNTDKWFEWEKQWTLGINQSFVSLSHEFSNQWTNAPPFQPPRLFLFS